ncbi:MAG TPA: MMPL family transporter [Gammaproteobacteria bacterium]|nr:MMPL family transporter [Gammaproteobacteria bacterium]
MTLQEQLLVERLGQGPGSQLVFISVDCGPARCAEVTAQLESRLLESGLFSQVADGHDMPGVEAVPAPILESRFLLADIDVSERGLRRALEARLADMAVFSGADMLALVAADPYLTALAIMENLAPAGLADEGAWRSPDGMRAYLVARTEAPAFEIGAQQAAMEAIRAAVLDLTGEPPELHGVGVYGVALQRTIRSEAEFRSALAAAAIALVLLAAYRRPSVLVIVGVPLAIGCLAGLAAVAVGFEAVHGITLAFGFTLFGVAVDYPLHALSHMRGGERGETLESIWPTLRLGALTTVIGYAAIAASGSRGLAQLGCFSAVGVTAALFATRSLIPDLVTRFATGRPAAGGLSAVQRPVFRHRVWIGVLAAGAGLLAVQDRIWSNDLASLTPLPAETLAEDRALRQALGAPDIRFLAATVADSEEAVLRETERLGVLLDAAAEAGELAAFQQVTDVLPSRATQARRAARLADVEEIEARLRAAAAGTPLAPGAFAPFVEGLRRTAEKPPFVTARSFEGTALEDFVSGKLYDNGERWVSLATLHGVREPARLGARLDERAPAATLVDLGAASESLVARYRLRVLEVLGLALLAIGLLLLWRVGWGARLAWIGGTLAAALVMTVALAALALGSLSLFNLIAIVLVAGLGFDYALFFSRTEHGGGALRDTRHALLVCAVSTLAAFGVLAFSSVPILRGIGICVALGVTLCYGVAQLGLAQRSAEPAP